MSHLRLYPIAWSVAVLLGAGLTFAFMLVVPPGWAVPLAFPFLIGSVAVMGTVGERVLRR